ncbi:MAG: DUF3137 domain-containing protein [Campylobacterales bacterium]|nr:DUF3137 domain-containing protein [Campylobacterales bacterium]
MMHLDINTLAHHDDDHGRNEEFLGLFAVTPFTKKLHGTTQVTFDLAEKHLGFAGKGIQQRSKQGLKRITLDNTAFEKEFVVYASDPIEANFILTHTVMEQLTQLVRSYRAYVTLTFDKDRLYIAILNGYGFFQPITELGFSKRELSFKDVERGIDALELAYKIVERLRHHHLLNPLS